VASGRAVAHHEAIAQWLACLDDVDPFVLAVHELEAGRPADGMRRVHSVLDASPQLSPAVVDRRAAALAPYRAQWGAAGPLPEISALRLSALSHTGQAQGTDEADLTRAEELAQAAGDDDMRAQVLCDRCRQHIGNKQPTAAREALDRLLPLAEAPALRAYTAERVAMVRALVLLWSYDPATVPAAEALVAKHGVLESMGWTMLSDWHHARGEPDAALRAARQAVAVAHGRYRLESLTTLAVALRAVEEADEASAVLDEVEQEATRTSEWRLLSRALVIRSHLLRGTGDAEGAAEALLRCRDLNALAGSRNPVTTLVLGLVLGGSLRRLDELARLTPDDLGLPLDEQPPPLRAALALHRFMVAVGLGEPDEARSWLVRLAVALDERQGPLDPDGIWLMEVLATYAGPADCRVRLAELAADQRSRIAERAGR
jgi:hypothetical protein